MVGCDVTGSEPPSGQTGAQGRRILAVGPPASCRGRAEAIFHGNRVPWPNGTGSSLPGLTKFRGDHAATGQPVHPLSAMVWLEGQAHEEGRLRQIGQETAEFS